MRSGSPCSRCGRPGGRPPPLRAEPSAGLARPPLRSGREVTPARPDPSVCERGARALRAPARSGAFRRLKGSGFECSPQAPPRRPSPSLRSGARASRSGQGPRPPPRSRPLHSPLSDKGALIRPGPRPPRLRAFGLDITELCATWGEHGHGQLKACGFGTTPRSGPPSRDPPAVHSDGSGLPSAPSRGLPIPPPAPARRRAFRCLRAAPPPAPPPPSSCSGSSPAASTARRLPPAKGCALGLSARPKTGSLARRLRRLRQTAESRGDRRRPGYNEPRRSTRCDTLSPWSTGKTRAGTSAA